MTEVKVTKRDGRVVPYEIEKIERSIELAMNSMELEIRDDIIPVVQERVVALDEKVIDIEKIQDIIEETLMDLGYNSVAKAYIIHREKRKRQRELRASLGVVDDLKMGINAAQLLKSRYLMKDENGDVIETPSELFRRVAKAVAVADRKYDKDADLEAVEELFYRAMVNMEFLPNSPALMSAGINNRTLAACFHIRPKDSLEDIFEKVKETAIITKMGGGVGLDFSLLRPKNDKVGSTGGISSGPVSFMQVFDSTIDVCKQGSTRRGALMGTLRCDSPDILEFIRCKQDGKTYTNFNISVLITDEFMKAYHEDRNYDLINPRNGEVVANIPARTVMDQIIYMAHSRGDPGLIFIDVINDKHPIKNLEVTGINVCVTGDTLVAIADGEGYKSIKELAEIGNDIPVYAFDGNKVVKSMGRNPRKTREQADVYELTFTDGSKLKATKDHKIMFRDGSYKKLGELQKGDSLMPYSRYQYDDGKYCSISCKNVGELTGRKKWSDNELLEHIRVFVKEQGKLPTISEWNDYSKGNSDIPSREVIRIHLGGLKQANQIIGGNHRVESIRYLGKEDVYNLTVDDYHNYAIVTNPNDSTRDLRLPKQSGIFIANCGEIPMAPNESCLLGAINLSKLVKEEKVDFKELKRIVGIVVHFLDNMLDINIFPLKAIKKATEKTRKIGVGIMGWAEMLIQMGIPYESKEALELAEKVMSFIDREAHNTSKELAVIRGNFPLFADYKKRYSGMRNSVLTTVAPTGSRSILAGTSSGIEPLYAIAETRVTADGIKMPDINKYFIEKAKELDIWNNDMKVAIAKEGNLGKWQLEGIDIPDDFRALFKTAHEISPDQHILMQAAFQKYVGASISKTVNLNNSATLEDVKNVFLDAFSNGCKGVTVFRDKCLDDGEQVLYLGCEICDI